MQKGERSLESLGVLCTTSGASHMSVSPLHSRLNSESAFREERLQTVSLLRESPSTHSAVSMASRAPSPVPL